MTPSIRAALMLARSALSGGLLRYSSAEDEARRQEALAAIEREIGLACTNDQGEDAIEEVKNPPPPKVSLPVIKE